MVFSLFKSSKHESNAQNADPKFDPKTLTMVQPGSPSAPTMNANGVVAEQPVSTLSLIKDLNDSLFANFPS
ncbi:hypothetical protein BDV10DRAFT_177126 [Aspergillus recurvatus]